MRDNTLFIFKNYENNINFTVMFLTENNLVEIFNINLIGG